MEVPDKIYVHEASAHELTENLPYHIEYVEINAFIEKAEDFIRRKICDYIVHYNYGSIHDMETTYIDGRFFEDFKNYIKGE